MGNYHLMTEFYWLHFEKINMKLGSSILIVLLKLSTVQLSHVAMVYGIWKGEITLKRHYI